MSSAATAHFRIVITHLPSLQAVFCNQKTLHATLDQEWPPDQNRAFSASLSDLQNAVKTGLLRQHTARKHSCLRIPGPFRALCLHPIGPGCRFPIRLCYTNSRTNAALFC